MLSWRLKTLKQQSKTNPELHFAEEGFSALPYWLFIVLFLAICFVASRLSPSESGIGTHEQLGLPPCGFLSVTGFPCPSCGLTTSIVWLMHGDIVKAALTQPFGVVLTAVLMLGTILSGLAILRRKSITSLVRTEQIEWIQYGLLVVMILSWIYKISSFAG
jgi:hypothetical protein